MTPAQCRAARGLLNWSRERLARSARLDVATVGRFEEEEAGVDRSNVEAMALAFEGAGVEFLDDGAPGVRLRPEPRVLTVDELNASNDE